MPRIKKVSKTKKLIIANWKNTPETLVEAKKNFNLIKSKKFNVNKVTPVICPSFLHLPELSKGYRGKNISFGAQNVYFDSKKPHTGEITINQLEDMKVEYVIVGHAERRELGEGNELVSKKIRAVLDAGLIPVLCVGELERDDRGEYLSHIEQELIESLDRVKKKDMDRVVIAYEPVWAIGKGKKAISTHEIHQIVIFIRKILVSVFDRKTAMDAHIIYGGSVDADNCEEILSDGEVAGVLIGRASSNPHTFVDILKKLS